MTNLKYRPGVVAVFTNAKAQLLVCERTDSSGAWQLPQGGIEPGESPDAAVIREVAEELGTDHVVIMSKTKDAFCYDFPAELRSNANRPIAQQFVGQSQYWYLMSFERGHGPDLAKSDGEFQSFQWQDPQWLIDNIIEWKRDVYKQALKALGVIK